MTTFATKDDVLTLLVHLGYLTYNSETEKEAYKICLEKIEKHGLAMKLVQAEYTFETINCCFILPQTEESISVNW